jgi:hypothetical protein
MSCSVCGEDKNRAEDVQHSIALKSAIELTFPLSVMFLSNAAPDSRIATHICRDRCRLDHPFQARQ